MSQNNPAKAEIMHHSRLLKYRRPQGAMPCGDTLYLRIDISKHWRLRCCLLQVFFENGDQRLYEMDCIGQENDRDIYSYRLEMPQKGQLLYYRFVLNDGKFLRYYGAESGQGILSEDPKSPSYQITVFGGQYKTPDWFKKATVYQIFVDRFARGDAHGGLARASYHEELGRRIYKHENWEEQPLYTPLEGAREYSPCDFFGGDLQGIINHLDYLADMGISCLYLNPIFEADSNHKYNTSDYHKIDPMFGNQEDFKRLCAEAKKRGIAILLDGVFSHTGDDSLYFNKYGRYQTLGAYQDEASPFFDWYSFTNFPDEYASWWGFSSLPEVREMQPSYLDFILENEDSVIKHWIREGSMGWRLDVADELPDEFLQKLRSAAKEANPDAVVLGEVWEDASNKFSMNTQRKYVMGQELDSVMNYPLRQAILDFLLEKSKASSFCHQIETLREHYPKEFFYACLNLISSHDVPRALSLLGGAPDKDSGLSREEQAQFSLSPENRSLGLLRMRLASFLQMILPGTPCIYYGDEAGLEGLMDPFNRGTYPWGKEDKGLKECIRALAKIRKNEACLQTGRFLLFAPQEGVLCIIRFCANGKDAFGNACEDSLFIGFVNRNSTAIDLDCSFARLFEGPDANHLPSLQGKYHDLLSDWTGEMAKDCLTIRLEGFSSRLLKKNA